MYTLDTSIRISPQKSTLIFNNLQFGPRLPIGLLKRITNLALSRIFIDNLSRLKWIASFHSQKSWKFIKALKYTHVQPSVCSSSCFHYKKCSTKVCCFSGSSSSLLSMQVFWVFFVFGSQSRYSRAILVVFVVSFDVPRIGILITEWSKIRPDLSSGYAKAELRSTKNKGGGEGMKAENLGFGRLCLLFIVLFAKN